jgi:hypothetical protein
MEEKTAKHVTKAGKTSTGSDGWEVNFSSRHAKLEYTPECNQPSDCLDLKSGFHMSWASAAIFLILEMSQPFSGLMQISSAPLRNALRALWEVSSFAQTAADSRPKFSDQLLTVR